MATERMIMSVPAKGTGQFAHRSKFDTCS